MNNDDLIPPAQGSGEPRVASEPENPPDPVNPVEPAPPPTWADLANVSDAEKWAIFGAMMQKSEERAIRAEERNARAEERNTLAEERNAQLANRVIHLESVARDRERERSQLG